MKRDNRKRVTFLLIGLSTLFLAICLYLVYFQLFQAPKLVANEYNPRNNVDETRLARGRFLDRKGEVLAYSEMEDTGYVRKYPYPRTYYPILGYTSTRYGKTGLERVYNTDLLNLKDSGLLGRLQEAVEGQGRDLRLTIDHELQIYGYDLLEGQRGAIVAMDSATGKIRAMVSRPSVNIEALDEIWNEIIEDPESPLLNRATQGLYTPGSVMKVLSALSFLETGIDLNYEDSGEAYVDGFVYHNYNNAVHGNIDLREALIYSSNTYFVEKAAKAGAQALKDTAERFFFNREIPMDLEVANSIVDYAPGMDANALASAAFGQGKTLVTPLNMALVLSGIAQAGEIMTPQLVESVELGGASLRKFDAKSLGIACSSDHAALLKKDLIDTAEYYGAATVGGATVGGKTGTADTQDGKTNAWFAGFMEQEGSSLVVVVVLEDVSSTGGEAAAPLARAMFNKWLEVK